MTTKKRGPEDMRKSRAKNRRELAAMLDNLIDDVEIFTEWKDGKRVVTFDMAKTTNEALELVAQAQGKTLDEILRGVITKHLKEGAKLKMVKEGHERRAKIAELREDQRKLQAEIAKYARRGE